MTPARSLFRALIALAVGCVAGCRAGRETTSSTFRPGEAETEIAGVAAVVVAASGQSSGTLLAVDQRSFGAVAAKVHSASYDLAKEHARLGISQGLRFHTPAKYTGWKLSAIPPDQPIVILDFPADTQLLGYSRQLRPILSNQKELDAAFRRRPSEVRSRL